MPKKKTPPAAPSLHGIHRRPGRTPNEQAYFHVTITRRGVGHSKIFSVRRYGTEDAALAAARTYRDRLLRTLKPYTRAERASKLNSTNTSGVAGVWFRPRFIPRNDGLSDASFWYARTPRGVKPMRTKSFSIARYGERGAFALAVKARKAFLREFHGDYNNKPSAPLAVHDTPRKRAR